MRAIRPPLAPNGPPDQLHPVGLLLGLDGVPLLLLGRLPERHPPRHQHLLARRHALPRGHPSRMPLHGLLRLVLVRQRVQGEDAREAGRGVGPAGSEARQAGLGGLGLAVGIGELRVVRDRYHDAIDHGGEVLLYVGDVVVFQGDGQPVQVQHPVPAHDDRRWQVPWCHRQAGGLVLQCAKPDSAISMQ